MAVREQDDCFAADERLYRSVAVKHIDGNRVLREAIVLPGCSFCRQHYAESPEDCLDLKKRPQETVVAWRNAAPLPEPYTAEQTGKGTVLTWVFELADDPKEDGRCHCEIRVKRDGETYSETGRGNPKSNGTRKALKDRIADRLRVL